MDRPSSRYLSLEQFVEQEIGGGQWQEYLKVRGTGIEALRKTGVLDEPLQDLNQVPYDDPEAASRFGRRLALEFAFADEISQRGMAGDWLVEGREEADVGFSVLDPRSFRRARFDFVGNRILLNGRCYEDVSLTRARPLTVHEQMVSLVREYVRRHSPEDKVQADVRAYVVAQLGYDFPKETIDKAIVAADLHPDWSKGGRRGSRIKGGNPPA